MIYSPSDIENLAKGVFPKRCLFSQDIVDGEFKYSRECLLDKGDHCSMTTEGKENCAAWRDVNIFRVEKLAQDLVETRARLDSTKVEKHALAQAIGEAIIGAGIAQPVPMTGPELILMLQSLSQDYLAAKKERNDLRGVVASHEESISVLKKKLEMALADVNVLMKGQRVCP